MPPDVPHEADPARGAVSRRTLIASGLGATAVATAVAAAGWALSRVPDRGPTRLTVSDMLQKRPFHVAHRGGSTDWPEFSMNAFRNSVEHGVDALEISLARSADGVWFGLHDATLDRTSGTSGFRADAHTWAEIQRYSIRATGPRAAGQAAQPYLRLEDLLQAYAARLPIFIDPKAASRKYHAELLSIMDGAVARPTESFIAKYYGTGKQWAAAARERGYRAWGFYFGRDILSGKTPLAATQDQWDLLGLDVEAPSAVWQQITGYGKPVIAHTIATRAQAEAALADGAQGMMVSGVTEVLGS